MNAEERELVEQGRDVLLRSPLVNALYAALSSAEARIEELEGERVSYQREMQEIVRQLQERLDERRVELESALASARDLRVELHWRVDQLDTAEARIKELEGIRANLLAALDERDAALARIKEWEKVAGELGEALEKAVDSCHAFHGDAEEAGGVDECAVCIAMNEGHAALAALDELRKEESDEDE